MFKVYRTGEFERLMNKLLTKEELKRIDKIESEISEKGFYGKAIGICFSKRKKN